MYSQKNEEAVILQYCGPVGRFLDIGAYDGVNYSNTMCLVERGWEGIMVEPALEAFQALLKNHGGNERITLIQGAVVPANSPKVTKFWPNQRTFSTTEQSNTRRFEFEGFGPQYWIPRLTFLDIFDAFPPIVDVLSIDTEGSSLNLLWCFPLCLLRFPPRVICVEHDGLVGEVNGWAGQNGYKQVMGNEENAILVAKEFA